MLKRQGAQRFSAKVYQLGINPCVDVPQRVSQAFGRRGYVPVTGTLNGHLIRATLVPKGGGRHRLFLNGDMRKRARVDVGNGVDLVVDVDNEPRTVPMPKEFALALQKNRKAKTAFETDAVPAEGDSHLPELDQAARNAEAERREDCRPTAQAGGITCVKKVSRPFSERNEDEFGTISCQTLGQRRCHCLFIPKRL